MRWRVTRSYADFLLLLSCCAPGRRLSSESMCANHRRRWKKLDEERLREAISQQWLTLGVKYSWWRGKSCPVSPHSNIYHSERFHRVDAK